MFWDSVAAGFKVFTYWQTYIAGLEYLAIFLVPMLFFGWFMERSSGGRGTAVGCLSMIVVPILQIAAMEVFALSLGSLFGCSLRFWLDHSVWLSYRF